MAVPADTCIQCRALVRVAEMAAHITWHNALSAMLGGHPHGPVTPLRRDRDREREREREPKS